MHHPDLNVLRITHVNVKVECAISLNEQIFQQLKASIEIRSVSLTKVQRVTRVTDAPAGKTIILMKGTIPTLTASAKKRPALLNEGGIQQRVMGKERTTVARALTPEEKPKTKNINRKVVIRRQGHHCSLQKDRFPDAGRTSQDWRSKNNKMALTSIFVQGDTKSMKTTLTVSNASQERKKLSKGTHKRPTYENGHHFPCTEELWD